jgi:hypothetical protein
MFRSYDHHPAEKYIATLGLLNWHHHHHISQLLRLWHQIVILHTSAHKMRCLDISSYNKGTTLDFVLLRPITWSPKHISYRLHCSSSRNCVILAGPISMTTFLLFCTSYKELIQNSKSEKCKVIPVPGRRGPRFEMSRLPHFPDNCLKMVVRLSVLHASCTLSPGRFLVLISVRGLVNPHGHSATGRIR